MKRKFSKILGVGLTMALLTSLLLTAAPVSALTQPSVTVDDSTIGVETDYSIMFNLNVGFEGESTLTFASGVAGVVKVTAGAAGANITCASVPGSVTVTGDDTASPYILTSGQSTIFTADTTAAVRTVDLVLAAGSATIAKTTGTATISESALGGGIIIEFPTGTDLTNVLAGDIALAATYGIGSSPITAGTFVIVKSPSTTTGPTLTATLNVLTGDNEIGPGAMVQVIVEDVQSPDTAGSYTLDVSTTNEAAVTSAPYAIGVPTIPVLPGIVKLYNPNGILMNQWTGDDAINVAVAAAGASYTIVVGAGEYEITSTITIALEGLALESSAGATTTIIEASGVGTPAIHIQADDVIVDGFTLDGNPNDGIWIKQGADDVTIQNNVFFEGEGSAIVLEGENDGVNVVTGATISDNIFEDCYTAITLLNGATDNTISDNTITGCTDTTTAITIGGGSTLALATQGNTITGNTITDNEGSGIWLFAWSGGFLDDNVISGNTISENEGNGIVIASTATDVTGLVITGNDITDNEGVGILIESWGATNAIKFNTITGNDADNDGYGLTNDGGVAVDATLNWWGTTVAADIAAMINDVGTLDVTDYEPFLTDTADAVFSATDVATGSISLDAEDEVGVKVEGATNADVIAVAKYTANPAEAIADALAFYDVYVVGTSVVDPTIKFYASGIDANTDLYAWSADTDTWVELTDAEYSAFGGYVHDTVDADLLDRTPFVLVAGAAATLDAPEALLAPDVGAEDVSLTPTFAWEPVADADGYYFQLADNANFVVPLVKLEGDLGRLVVTAYHYVTELDYSVPYYWRVKTVSGTAEAGDLMESDWVVGVFITIADPVEPEPEVWMCSEGLTFDTREALEAHLATAAAHQPVEAPDIIVPLPAETPITPGWIYAIIGVGAVLVIALIVLIVRTRRVA